LGDTSTSIPTPTSSSLLLETECNEASFIERTLLVEAAGTTAALNVLEGGGGAEGKGWGATPLATAERRLLGGRALERG
jgi:hypothetical protein